MAFKNLFCGTQWKLQFINCHFQCTGNYRCGNYRINRMMHKLELQNSYVHKIENNQIILFTIVLQGGSKGERNIFISRGLEKPVSALIEKINLELKKFDAKGNKIKRNHQLYTEPNALLLCDGEPVDTDKACSTIFTLNGGLMLRLFGNYHACLINTPLVKRVKLPTTPVSNTYIYPVELETYYVEEFGIRWFKNIRLVSPNDENWIEVGRDFHYFIQESDVNYYLKFECVPKKGDLVGPCCKEIIKNKVQPNQCSYYYHNIHKLTEKEVQKDMFRLVSYNVLADYYVHTREGKRMFSYCPLYALEKNQRYSAIINELIGYKPDLICLQEVDEHVFASLLKPVLEEQDYNGFICPKYKAQEGTACFYRCKNFNILHHENYNYGIEILGNPKLRNILLYVCRKDELFKKITSLTHCLQLLAFESKVKRNEILIVGNIHLYANPEADLIRILQVAVTFELIKGVLHRLQKLLSNKNTSVILCGDFNSTPSSPIHSYIENSTFIETCQDREIMENYDGTVFNHSWKMESACKELLFTNYTPDFQGCLDYIYYEKGRLEVDKIYPTADEDTLKANDGIPSVSFPSDHIPLIVDFKWKY